LLPPRRVPLAAEQYRQAVDLLAELLLDAADARSRPGEGAGRAARVRSVCAQATRHSHDRATAPRRRRPAPSAGWGHRRCTGSSTTRPYVGKIRWRDKIFDGVHEPLVDEFTFAKAQAIMQEANTPNCAETRATSSSPGLLRCGRCGKACIGMSAKGNGGRNHYYACPGRQKYGPKACDGERLPREEVDEAVLRQLTSIYRDEQVIGEAITKANEEAERRRPEFEQRFASIGAEITRAEQALERYYEAFEQGSLSRERCEARLTRLQARLDDLHAQEAEFSLSAPDEATQAPTAAELVSVADLLEAVVAEAEPQKAKALLWLLIRGTARQRPVREPADLPARYRRFAQCPKKAGRAGIEPATLEMSPSQLLWSARRVSAGRRSERESSINGSIPTARG
jgi:exonuclease VII small subunit